MAIFKAEESCRYACLLIKGVNSIVLLVSCFWVIQSVHSMPQIYENFISNIRLGRKKEKNNQLLIQIALNQFVMVHYQPLRRRLHHLAHREAEVSKAFPKEVLKMVGNRAYKTNFHLFTIIKSEHESLNECLETRLHQIMDVRMRLVFASKFGKRGQIL